MSSFDEIVQLEQQISDIQKEMVTKRASQRALKSNVTKTQEKLNAQNKVADTLRLYLKNFKELDITPLPEYATAQSALNSTLGQIEDLVFKIDSWGHNIRGLEVQLTEMECNIKDLTIQLNQYGQLFYFPTIS